MKPLLTLTMLVAVVLAPSCLPMMQPALTEIPRPPQPIVQNGYSFVPPDEPGWMYGPRSEDVVALVKEGKHEDESFAIVAYTQVLPELNSREEFLGYAKSAMIMQGGERHTVVSQETTTLTINSQSCARTMRVSEDNGGQRRSERTDPRLIEAVFVLCRHPNGTTGVVVSYSHRYYSGNEDPGTSAKAQAVFDSLAFPDLPSS